MVQSFSPSLSKESIGFLGTLRSEVFFFFFFISHRIGSKVSVVEAKWMEMMESLADMEIGRDLSQSK